MTRQELIEQCERECCFLDECHKFRINENSLGVYCVMMDASAPMNFNRPGAGTCYLKEYLSYTCTYICDLELIEFYEYVCELISSFQLHTLHFEVKLLERIHS